MTNDTESDITGTLEDWWYDEYNHVIWGFIYGDSKGRFADGCRIHTSSLKVPKKIDALKEALYEGSVLRTLNSTYRLGRKQQKIE